MSKITLSMIEEAHNWAQLMQRWNARGFVCEQCGDPNLGPVLEHDLWRTIAHRHAEVLCGPCMEVRLGRRIQFRDLNGSEWNVWRYAFMYIMYILFSKEIIS